MSRKKIIIASYLLFILLGGCSPQKDAKVSSLPDEFIVIGHRGASAHAPEHTIKSYELAKKLGAGYIEIDLQMTKDQVLVALHDDTVDRTTNGIGDIQSYTLEEIKELNAGAWFNEKFKQQADPSYEELTIPTLEEVFEHFGKEVNYYIETKSPNRYPKMEEKLIELLKKYNLIEVNKTGFPKVIIQSFSDESLKHIHEKEPSIPLIQLISYRTPAELSEREIRYVKEYAVGIGPNYQMVDEVYVKNARNAGLHIHPYTVNSQKDLEQLIDWGVTGVFTDFGGTLSDRWK